MAKEEKDALTKHLENVTGKESEGATIEHPVAEAETTAEAAPAGKGPVFTRGDDGRLVDISDQ